MYNGINFEEKEGEGLMKILLFVLKVVGIAILSAGFVAGWSIIIGKQYSIPEVPTIILSTVNVVAMVALAFFTYSYMKSTAVMAEEMRATREMEFVVNNRPRIITKFENTSNGMVYIAIMNVGSGAARNIRLKATPELRNSRNDSLDRWPAFKNGISYLAPSDKIRYFFDTSFSLDKLKIDYLVDITYDWALEGRPTIHDTFPLEITPYIGTDLASYKDFSTLIDEVEKIRKELEKGR